MARRETKKKGGPRGPKANPQATQIPGNLWPPLPTPLGGPLLALLLQLDDSQWWSAERLREHQLTQLAALLEHAHRTIPLCRERLDAAGIRPGEALAWGDFQRLPILTRSELQAVPGGLQAHSVPPGHGEVGETRTSGSTGKPILIHATHLVGAFWNAFTLRDHLWHNRGFRAKLGAIRSAPEGTPWHKNGHKAPSWGPPADLAFNTGPSASLNIDAGIEQQLEWLLREQPAYLLTYPTNAAALARLCLERGVELPFLREVRTVSESLPDDLRELCREAWGVPLVDAYSSREVGYMALQCPEHDHYHVQAENVILEVLDAAGRPCGPGQIGRVVVTTLHNFAMPLLRYEIGDYAEVGEACACGRGLPVLTRILGRVRNMLTLPDGRQGWPVFSKLYRRSAEMPIRQMQIVQKSLERLEVRLVTRRPMSGEEEAEFAAAIRESFGYPFVVDFVYPEALERSAGGKFEEFLSEVTR